MAKAKHPRGIAAGSPAPQTEENVMGYFRVLLEKSPDLLHARNNQAIVDRWLKDHPGFQEMPRKVRNTLANLKSQLRKKGRQGKPAARRADGSRLASLEQLEIRIDDAITLAKTIDSIGLDSVYRLLRKARNEVVWMIGQQS